MSTYFMSLVIEVRFLRRRSSNHNCCCRNGAAGSRPI